MKYLFPYLILFTVLVTNLGCNQQQIQKDMVTFDQAYIPVLYHVYDNDLNQAAKSMFMLDYRWQQFNSKYNYLGENDLDWKEHSRLIDDWLSDAYDAIMCNDQLTAYIQLDHVRYEMMEMRRGYDFEYFLDAVWDFEGSLSMLAEASREDGTMVCSSDELSFLVREAGYLWEIVDAAKVNTGLFGFTEDKSTLFKKYKQEITRELAIMDADRSYEKLNDSVNATFESYLKLLTLFGDFDSTRTFYALNR